MGTGAENINPYAGDKRDKGEQVREMFDNIAPAYDFMNRAMTMGLDCWWRRRAVGMVRRHLSPLSSPHILDVATGTGDLAMLLAQKIPNSHVTGIDLSAGMVSIGRSKVEEAGLADRVNLGIGDCLSLPFAPDSFDAVTVAYGVRNFERLLDGYREMLRVLRPGAMLCVIELSTPTLPVVRPLYNFYASKVIPMVGSMVSKDNSAYSYLPQSIAAVAQGAEMNALIESAGFVKAKNTPLTLGVCTIYTAYKKS